MIDQIKERIEGLRKRINYLNYRYYTENISEISDREFDSLIKSLAELESQHPKYDDPNSPTHRVGNDLIEGFDRYEHLYPMQSLSNTYSVGEVIDFMGRVEKECGEQGYCCELKFDGTAISLTYERGRFVRAVTRGDGTRGDDVSAAVRTIRAVPMELRGDDVPELMEVRGEIYMSFPTFERLNIQRVEQGEEPFANPRNAASGSLKLQNIRQVAERSLECVLYSVQSSEQLSSQWGALDKLAKWGFVVSPYSVLCPSITEVEKYLDRWDSARHDLPFATDGVVIKVDSLSVQHELGSTAKAPRYAVAYKFKAEEALTRLLSVEYGVGRTGAITPVANLEAVQLSGTVVRRASLHNAEQIEMLDVRLGDLVAVEKGGEIIPKITRVDITARPSNSTPFIYATHCPACGAVLVKGDGQAKHYCPNALECPPQIVGRIVHFVSRKAMYIDSLGEQTIEMLVREGLVHDAADLYDLQAEQLERLERLGELSARNIIIGIKESTKVPFSRSLFALGIRYVGETTAKKITQTVMSIQALSRASLEELVEIEEVGSKIGNSIIEYFADRRNVRLIERLCKAGLNFETEQKEQLSDLLAGLKVVVTGTFANYSRDVLKAMVEQHGGENQSSVGRNTDILLAGSGVGPSKMEKAEKLGTRIMSIDEFEKIIYAKKTETETQQLTLF